MREWEKATFARAGIIDNKILREPVDGAILPGTEYGVWQDPEVGDGSWALVHLPSGHTFGLAPNLEIARAAIIELKGYVVGHKGENGRPQVNYIERSIMPPVAVGGLIMHVTPVHTAKFDYLDLKLEF